MLRAGGGVTTTTYQTRTNKQNAFEVACRGRAGMVDRYRADPVRRGRRRRAVGTGDRALVPAVRGMLLLLVQQNDGRIGASGESCVDLVGR